MPRLAIQDQNASLSFNSTQTTKVKVSAALGATFSNGYSIECRVKMGSVGNVTVWGVGNSSNDAPFTRLYANPGTRVLRWQIRNDAATSLKDVALTTVIDYSQWYHIVVSDNLGSVKIYVNGVADATNFDYTPTGTFTVNQTSIGAFARTSDANSLINGNIARFKTYDVALTAEQALKAYNNSLNISHTSNFTFNEGAGPIAYDSSGNGNNGTITNGTWVSDTPTKLRKQVDGNLVYNGDFEYAPPFTAATNTNARWINGTASGVAGVNYTKEPHGWGTVYPTGVGNAMFDTTEKHSGSYSMKLSALAGVDVGVCIVGVQNVRGVRESGYAIPCLPNTSYTFSGWMKTNVTSGSATTGARFEIATWNGAGAYETIPLITTNVTTTTEWTQYTGTFTTNSTARFIVITCKLRANDGAGTLIMDAWFDDIELRPTTPVTRTAISTPRTAISTPRTVVT